MVQEPGTDLMYVIERAGRIVRFDKDNTSVTTPELFGDIRGRVETNDSPGDERGLLGIAFHPDWPVTEEVFLAYTALGGSYLEDRVSRFTVAGDGTLNEGSEEILLAIDDNYSNHNGGMIAFGPDGMLYVGTGDGGSGGDPDENGQNTQALLGKILRIDVDTVSAPYPYGLPTDNPFIDDPSFAPEIHSWGWRNPWRFSFDRGTGELWVGDVGQNQIEEIDVAVAGSNYGWNTYEGTSCYDDTNNACDDGGFTVPVLEYPHTSGRNAVIGGYVYRGNAIPALVGTYVFGDASSAEIFQLLFDNQGAPRDLDDAGVVIADAGDYASSFAEDADGELYFMRVESNQILKLVPAGAPTPNTFPDRLSETGCVTAGDARVAASGMIPYGINHPLWSDGAAKTRFLALPDGATIGVGSDGDMTLPVGTVLMKHFLIDGLYVETRLLMRHADGGWAGYTYEWNPAQNDADLLAPAGKQKTLGNGQTWVYPSRNGCLSCHTGAAGRTLGLEVAQLNGGYQYDADSCGNQLTTWDAIGLFSAALSDDPANLPALPAVDDASAANDERARAVLHVNCSMCHRPAGGGGGNADLRVQTAFEDTNLCNATPAEGDLGVTGARLIVPGDPSRSLVSVRMHSTGVGRMPKLGSLVVDSAGTAVVDAFIDGLSTCP